MDALAADGEKVGLVKVRLYRPFPTEQFVAALPETVRAIAVLDRTKEPGAMGEPLYLDVVTALAEHMDSAEPRFARVPRVIGGRYGLSSKEFNPGHGQGGLRRARARARPKRHFTIGITDDVTHLSIPTDTEFRYPRPAGEVQAMFFGTGSDGTVGANKNTVKIIGEGTDLYAQGYFVYDSKKAGSVTVSHLRFGPNPIRSSYLIERADFVACHRFGLLGKLKVLGHARDGAHVPAQQPLPGRRGLGQPPRVRPGGAHRETPALLGDRRRQGRGRSGHGQPHQHRDAAVLLRAVRRPAGRRRRRAHQGVRPEDLRQARPCHRRAELRSHRPFAAGAHRGEGARVGDLQRPRR